jgi:hypothetical protein
VLYSDNHLSSGVSMTRKVVALVTLICLLAACKPPEVGTPRVPTPEAAKAAPAGKSFTQVVPLRFTSECGKLEDQFLKDESVETLPCVFTKDGTWYLVTDWDRQDHIKLSKCKNEEGSPIDKLPCIWVAKHPVNAQWNYLVYINGIG